eukprot:TRINITY_DN4855_c0_g2_i1.p1 TRINITY_DN4855_c0_g2~~TRINITY_DN4855_c0_g2_i1.p1  ORF type:complete len:263 (+),score=37.45 TRINITY_DN4855_c0_g2_i1:164-952(+)
MGLCKCRKITDLYCFNHKKAVCENCIATDHKTCTVGSYVKWLQDPDFDASVCEMCKEELTPDHVIRLMCLHMLHPECLDMHASSFPPNTAKAGYVCPVPDCKTPLVPTNPNSSTLSQILYNHIEHSSWFESKSQPLMDRNDSRNHRDNDSFDRTFDMDSSNRSPKQRSSFIPNETNIKDSANILIDSESNKRANPIFDDDADKYNKNQISKLIYNPAPLGAVGDAFSRRTRGGSPFTTKRILMIFALLSTLLIVAFLSTSLE